MNKCAQKKCILSTLNFVASRLAWHHFPKNPQNLGHNKNGKIRLATQRVLESLAAARWVTRVRTDWSWVLVQRRPCSLTEISKRAWEKDVEVRAHGPPWWRAGEGVWGRPPSRNEQCEEGFLVVIQADPFAVCSGISTSDPKRNRGCEQELALVLRMVNLVWRLAATMTTSAETIQMAN